MGLDTVVGLEAQLVVGQDLLTVKPEVLEQDAVGACCRSGVAIGRVLVREEVHEDSQSSLLHS